MKKSLLGLVAVGGMLLATSCSQDDLSLSGGKGQIVFEVGVNNPMLTRAISDGSGANTLIYQVYQNGSAVGEQKKINVESYPTTVEINNLEVNAAYTVVFWAQNSECEAYNTTDLKAIEVDYTNAKDNDESRDAFYAALPVTVLGGDTPQQTSVTLTRPFAQVNVGMPEKQLNGTNYTQSSMTLTGGVGDTFNALDGTASGDVQEVEFALNPVVTEELSVGDPAVTYTWLSMAYVLPSEDEDLVTASFVFEGTPNNATLEVNNVPLQTNYRTNILGNVQTGDVEIEVDQDPNFTDDNELNGELQAGGAIVSNFSYSYDNGNLKLSASYSGIEKEIDNAYFILTPGTAPQALRTRASELKLQATVNDQNKTLTYDGSPALDPGQYYGITVEITDVDEQTFTLTPTGGANGPGFTTPEEGGEEPGGDTEEVKIVTVKEFIAAEVSPTQVYQLTGKVSDITNTKYGNFNLTDDTGTVAVYGLSNTPQESGATANQTFSSMGIGEGDIITIQGYRTVFGETPQVGSGWLIKIDEKAPEPEDPTKGTFTLVNTASELTAGTYLMAGYKNDSSDNYQLWTGSFTSGNCVTIQYTFTNGTLTTSETPPAVEVELEAAADGAFYIKCNGKYLSASKNKGGLNLAENPLAWKPANNSKGGINLTATATDNTSTYICSSVTASSNYIRNYATSQDYGVVFFKKAN